ncbi:MAG: succinate dehydrogenase, cytochrome b556 subunit [Candidatus Nitrotoga sp.]|nr:succinate dehydrogenase, cytochrome b556 subunit [Candidatus Nitrotoga sp.]MBP0117690.1 succinate dehydrogenase, cytochrome b556 subunit [Candidatus Nitrotoga sp.]MBP0122819.1 succinate dehydrogenase, cytochrome b556 subunit [Candidatus Nitrotoga sp.]MBP0125703.1 succinate dehydrogenase, cytochrome b556 subunit [Candidatus Nitrotoga sp.]
MKKKRPIYFNLRLTRLPVPGLVSLLHRISGLALFLMLPLLLMMLQDSLLTIESYTRLTETLRYPISKALLIVALWALMHHVCAGIRHLLMNMHLGLNLSQARTSSSWVLSVSLGLTALGGVWLW